MTSDVISTIVKNNLCIGCGVCAAICPEHLLSMQFNRFGEYNPTRSKECIKDCGLCHKVCPFADKNDNEDVIGKTLYGQINGISHRPETGYYLNCYAGYAPKTRDRGASGGMATWLLAALLKKGSVDYVIAIVPEDNPDHLFRFAVLDDSESVFSSSGSAYYPVELSRVLQEIQHKPGRCAVIGLPCFIKAVRLAAQKNKTLREKIPVTLGIVCGQLKSRHFTDYIAGLAGIRKDDIKKVHYRGKSPDTTTGNYFYTFTRKDGTAERIYWEDAISEPWMNRWFTLNACSYCDDIFAECADVAFMDAWLPEYAGDRQGTNIVLVRSRIVQDMIDQGIKDEEICLDAVHIGQAVQSQKGVIEIKRHYLAHQLFSGHQQGFRTPEKRVAAKKINNLFLRQRIFQKDRMQRVSREFWNPAEPDIKHFNARMRPYLIRFRITEHLHQKLRMFHRTLSGE
jgi:coenzyme F420 hydrogenase subunit beta